jgi:hypothetical protein
MIGGRVIAAIALSVIATTPPLLGESIQPVAVTSTERVDFARGGTIHINDSSGYVNVEGWDQPEVEITITKSTNRFYKAEQPDEAKRLLDMIRVTIERRSGTDLVITTIHASRHSNWAPFLPPTSMAGVTVEYQIHAPRDSKLVMHGTGSMFVNGISGDIDANCGRGDILLMLPDSGTYSIDAKTKFGNVSSDFEGSALSKYLVGQRFARTVPPPARRLHLRMGFGGITIKAVPPEADAPVPPGTE